MNWADLITQFDYDLIRWLGHDSLSRTTNVITDELRNNPTFVYDATERFGQSVNMTSLSRLATICQMIVFDANDGPEGDGKRKALRRHWYQWYKTRFAIPFSTNQIGFEQDIQNGRWGLNWMGRLSQVYGNMVDNENVTYWDLWVEDGSRMIERNHAQLIHDANIIICVEKDSLFPDFREAAEKLGARVLISGKGKPSKAAAEKMLRDAFHFPDGRFVGYDSDGYTPMYEDVITHKRPLIVMSISDHDYDGESVIGPSFAEQLRTYTPFIREVRVGIRPRDAERAGYDLQDIAYQIKISNSAYVNWAIDKAYFEIECANCHEYVFVESANERADCPMCGMNAYDIYDLPEINSKTEAFGFEVEAMRTADYYPLLVNALLRVMPFDFITERLRIETVADHEDATITAVNDALEQNADFIAMRNEIERLQRLIDETTRNAYDQHIEFAREHRGDFWELGDDPDVSEFTDHVEARYSFGVWRPFDEDERTDALIDFMTDELVENLSELASTPIDWSVDNAD